MTNNRKCFALLLIPIAIYLLFATFHLAKFITADENIWIDNRIPQYWNSLLNGKWKKTYVNDKPGVTVALISGVGLPGYQDWDKIKPSPDKPSRSSAMESALFRFRLPVVIFTAFFSFYFFWVLLKITREFWLSLIAASLILLSPILVGISQIINPDSFLALFGPASVLSYWALLATREKKFIWLTGLTLALALLSKYAAAIIYPFMFISLIAFYLYKKEDSPEKRPVKKEIVSDLAGYISIILISMAFFALLLPASFVKPQYLFSGTINYAGLANFMVPIAALIIILFIDALLFSARHLRWLLNKIRIVSKYFPAAIYSLLIAFILINIANYLFLNDTLKLNLVPFDLGDKNARFINLSLFEKLTLQFRPLAFSIPPFVLFFVFWIWLRGMFGKIRLFKLVFILSLFIIALYAGAIYKTLLVTIRYSIMLYAPIAVLAAIGICDFAALVRKKIPAAAVFVLVILLSSATLWFTRPFYFNYMSDLLPKKYIITDAWGYGGYEAAQFFNNLPGVKNLDVWTNYDGTCRFFNGHCINSYRKTARPDKVDYYVITRRGQIVNRLNKTFLYDDTAPVWSLYIDNRPDNYIKIYKGN